MQNICISCATKYELDEHDAVYSSNEVKNLLRFCVPEVFRKSNIVENYDFLMKICPNCILVLNNFKTFKQKCMNWFDNLNYNPIIEDINQDHCFKQQEDQIKKSLKLCITQVKPSDYKCDICNKSYSTKYHLEAHKKLHSDLRPYICLYCGKSFKTTTDCRNHEKIHTNLKNYKCTEPGCMKGFNTITERQKHKLFVHTDSSQWRFECDYCRRKFAIKSHLDRHVKIHTGDKQFKCHICSYTCIEKHHLMKHIKMHNFVDTFKCSVCPMEYKHEKSLKLHLDKKHFGKVDTNVVEKEIEKNLICQYCGRRYARNAKLKIHIANNHVESVNSYIADT